MDDPYASPDSDGHASAPSPTDTTFNMSIIPFKRRGGQLPNLNSIGSTSVISSSDEEDDITPSAPQLRMLTSSPSEIHILAPTASNNETSTLKRTQRAPREDQTEENIDPKNANTNEAPPKKSNPIANSNDNEPELPAASRGNPRIDFVPDDSSIKDESTIMQQNITSSSNAIDPRTGLSTKVTVRKPRTGGPTEFVSSPPVHSANRTPRTRPSNLNWLTSDESMTDADDESRSSTLRDTPRHRDLQSNMALDRSTMSGALAGDEDSYDGVQRDEKQSEINFSDDEDNTPRRLAAARGKPLDVSSPNSLSQTTILRGEQSGDSPNKAQSIPPTPKAVEKFPARESASPKEDSGNFTSTSTKSDDSSQSIGRKRKHDEQLTDTPEEDFDEPDEQEFSEDESLSEEDPVTEKVTDTHSRSSPAKEDSVEPENNFTKTRKVPTPIFSADGEPLRLSTPSNPSGKIFETKSAETGERAKPKPFSNTTEHVFTYDDTNLQAVSKFGNGNGISTSPTRSPAITASEFHTPRKNTAVSESASEYSQFYPYSEPPLASSTPKGTDEPFDLMKFKRSSRARRVSMNTPPSHISRETSMTEIFNHNPDFSSLSSGYNFPSQPVRYETWDPTGIPLEFSPFFPVEGTIKRRNGAAPPPNSTNVTPVPKGLGEGAILDDEIKEAKARGRSTSDPAEEKWNVDPIIAGASRRRTIEGSERMLFTPTRVIRKDMTGDRMDGHNNTPTHNGKSKIVAPRATSVSPAPSNSRRAESPSIISDDDPRDGNDDHLWSGFTQSFNENKNGHDTSPNLSVANEADPVDSSLSLENVEFGVETPTSIGGKYSTSHDDVHLSHVSFNIARSRMSQTEAANDRLRDIVEAREFKAHGEGSKGTSSIVPSTAPNLQFTGSSNHNSPDENVDILRQRLAALELTVKTLRGQEEKYKVEIREQESHVIHWQESYSKAQKVAQENRSKILGLEEEAKKSQKKHDQELQAQKDLLAQLRLEQGQTPHRRWDSKQNGLNLFNGNSPEKWDGHGSSEDEDRDDLRNYSILLEQQIADHEKRRREELENQEAKFTQMLEEKEALVQHLEGELREYQALANQMPADFCSSRLLEDDPEDWEDENERSKDASQYYDESFDQIITEINGDVHNENFDEAAQQAEMSLRRIAEEAGLEEDLDKAQLAAFGIRQLRNDYDCLKKLLVDSEERVKSLMETNESTGKRVHALEDKIEELEGMKEALEKAKDETDDAMKRTMEEMESLRTELKVIEEKAKRAEGEKDVLKKDYQLSETRVKATVAEKEVLQRLLTQAKKEKDQAKEEKETLQKQSIEAEERAQGFEEEIVKLRRDLAGTMERVGYLEKEIVTGLKQQVSELEMTTSAMENEKEVLEQQISESRELLDAAYKEKEMLSNQLNEARKVSSEDTGRLRQALQKTESRIKELTEQHSAANQEIQNLQVKLTQSTQTVQKLALDKQAMKESTDKELKASRARLTQLRHDFDEKESSWNTLRTSLENQLVEVKSALSEQSPEIRETYENSLSRILSEMSKETYESADTSLILALENDLDEEIGNRTTVIAIIAGIRKLYEIVSEMKTALKEAQEKNEKWKGAVKRWEKEYKKERGRVEKLEKELRESETRLRAEKVSGDEKLNGLILALRR